MFCFFTFIYIYIYIFIYIYTYKYDCLRKGSFLTCFLCAIIAPTAAVDVKSQHSPPPPHGASYLAPLVGVKLPRSTRLRHLAFLFNKRNLEKVVVVVTVAVAVVCCCGCCSKLIWSQYPCCFIGFHEPITGTIVGLSRGIYCIIKGLYPMHLNRGTIWEYMRNMELIMITGQKTIRIDSVARQSCVSSTLC